MRYLECNHCGHLNPVNSEYLVFCQTCSRKISNNYKDWQKNNENKTFEDFKAEVCIAEEVKSDTLKERKKKD